MNKDKQIKTHANSFGYLTAAVLWRSTSETLISVGEIWGRKTFLW